jgi:predicted metal-dependent hydrolase
VAEIIELREIQEARARARRRRGDYQSLAEAVALLRENLAAVAELIRTAPEAAQPELLDRVEKLTAMIRFGMRMMEGMGDDIAGNS